MSDASHCRRIDSPIRSHPSTGSRQRQRSASVHVQTANTPAVKSLSALAQSDLHVDQRHLTSAHEKLIQWKRSVEQQLNRLYLLKLKEIDCLLDDGHTEIAVTFTATPLFEPLITLTTDPVVHIDSMTDDLHLDHTSAAHQFHLSSNNVLLSTSNRHALIYDHVSWKLTLYDPPSSSHSFDWDVNDYGEPCDLTYSPYLRRYMIITHRGIFLWSWPEQVLPLLIDALPPIVGNRPWTVASTADQSDVFVLFERGSYIEKWDSRTDGSSWQRLQRWSHHHLFERLDQRVRAIRMTSNYVAWTVETTTNFAWRMDLLDHHLQLVRQGVQIAGIERCSSCLLSNYLQEQYLIVDSNLHHLFLLDGHGSITLQSVPLVDPRVRNATVMINQNRSWLVLRLEKPNQQCFIPFSQQTNSA